MKSDEHLRLLIENRPGLVLTLARHLAAPAGRLRLVGPSGDTVWSRGEGAPGPAASIELPIGSHGSLRWDGPAPPPEAAWQAALSSLVGDCVESEAEMNQLVEDHISTTNQLMALYNIVYGTHETWDLADKLRVIVEEAGRQSGAGLSVLGLAGGAGGPAQLWSAEGRDRGSLAQEVLLKAAQNAEAHIASEPVHHCAAPVLLHGDVYGWIVVAEREDRFQGRDLKLVQALADLAAGFLLTARLQERVVTTLKIERELEIASQIQALLIPRELPRVPGCDVAAACFPASQIGGDFYAVQTLTSGDLVFALGDVTGKGVPAALLMAMTRTVFGAISTLEAEPEQVLSRLNEVLYADLGRVEKFVTLVVGRFKPAERLVELANAGHSPVLFVAANGMPALLEPSLPPLGIVREMNARATVLKLSPGSVLAIATDGITEARNPAGELFGIDRMTDALASGIELSSSGLAKRLLQQVAAFAAGAPQADDQTLLLLKGAA